MNGVSIVVFEWWTHFVLRVLGLRFRLTIGAVHDLCLHSKDAANIMVLV